MPDPNPCPVARALEIVGERWTLLIVRDLVIHGPQRFADLQQRLAGASPSTLSARLKRLEAAGVVERRFYEDRPPRAEYVLTDKGRALAQVVGALREWGERHAPIS